MAATANSNVTLLEVSPPQEALINDAIMALDQGQGVLELAIANGVTALTEAQARSGFIMLKGALTAAATIVVPAALHKRTWFRNDTTGGQVVQVQVGSVGTPVAAPAGDLVLLWPTGSHTLGTDSAVWTRSAAGVLRPVTVSDRLSLGSTDDTLHSLRIVKPGGTGTGGAPQAPLWIDHIVTSIDAGGGPDIGAVNAIIRYLATAPTTFDLVHTGIDSRIQFGDATTAPQGTLHTFTSVIDVVRSTSPNNEWANYFGIARLGGDPGATGSIWFADWNVHGGKDTQPGTLMGPVQLINNYFDGSPSRCESAALILVSRQGAGAGAEDGHAGWTTYPVDNGLVIAGTSSSADGRGFRRGIRIGGASASPWLLTGASKIGVGILIQDLAEKAIHLLGGNTGIYWGADGDADQISLDRAPGFFLHLTGRLRVTNPRAINDPILEAGSDTAAQSNSIVLKSGSGKVSLFVAGDTGHFLPDTAAGDTGIRAESGRFLIGKNGATHSYLRITNGATDVNALQINGGARVSGHLSATKAWDPPNLPSGQTLTETMSVPGAALGDVAACSFDLPLPDGVYFAQPQVSAANTVKVTLINASGAPQDLAAGTLRASVWKYA